MLFCIKLKGAGGIFYLRMESFYSAEVKRDKKEREDNSLSLLDIEPKICNMKLIKFKSRVTLVEAGRIELPSDAGQS